MAQFFQIHPANPQFRLVKQAVEIIQRGGLVAYPTDSAYALGCHIGDKLALDRIRGIRQLTKEHNFTLMCRDLSEVATYAKVNNQMFRLLKSHTPGPFTFILEATSETPRRLKHPKRRTIGIRIPDHPIVMAILSELNEPMMTSSLIMPGDELPLTDPYDIRALMEATTVVDLTGDAPQVARQGCGQFKE